MNATLINGGKVHRLKDGFARCGVGRNAKTRTWQMEFCAVTCGRCVKLEKPKTNDNSATECEPHGRIINTKGKA